jgi:guanine deaminase
VEVTLPERPPFAIRARVITPLGAGGIEHLPDGVVRVDADGRIASVSAFEAASANAGETLDLRPFVVVPGLVDLHAHLPQLPNAGIGFGMDLLAWLERHIFPLERRWADPAVAERVAPAAFEAMAAAGTTTVLAYGAVYPESLDAAFRAAKAHGIRAVLGKVMMDRVTYDERRVPGSPELTELSLRQSADLCARWNGVDAGRLGYAFTPRFAVACTADLLRESAALAASSGALWQTHLSEDRGEIEAVSSLFPEARDYVDVYDRAGALGPNAVFAHAVHLSDDELARLVESGSRVAHCPASNLFLASGVMPLARYLAAGLSVGLGSDVAAGPEVSIWMAMRVGAYSQNAYGVMTSDPGPVCGPLDWLRLATLEGARALGLDDVTGSLEAGKEADLIVIDPSTTEAVPGDGGLAEVTEALDEPSLLVSRLIFRSVPGTVRGTYVRGRRLKVSITA